MPRDPRVRVRIEGDASGAVAAVSKTQGAFTRFGSFLASRFVFTFGDIQRAATAAMDAVRESLDLSAQQRVLSTQLEEAGLSFDEFIEKAKAATKETVSMKDIISTATRTKLLGVGFEEMIELMEIARVTSAATGDSVTTAFEDISLGLARQSKMILDNQGFLISLEKANADYAAQLGKSAEALTDSERRTALLNQVLEQGRDRVDKFGDAAAGLKEKMEQGAAGVSDLRSALLELFRQFAEGATESAKGRDAIDNLTEGIKSSSIAARVAGEIYATYINKLTELKIPHLALLATYKEIPTIIGDARKAMDAAGDSAGQLGNKIKNTGEDAEEAAGHFKNATEAAIGLGSALGEVTSVELEAEIGKINEALTESRETLGANSDEYVRLEEIAREKIERLQERIQNLRDGLGDLQTTTRDNTEAFTDYSWQVNDAAIATDRLSESTRHYELSARQAIEAAGQLVANVLGGRSEFAQIGGGQFTTWTEPTTLVQDAFGRLSTQEWFR